MKEKEITARVWAKSVKFTLPVLLDLDGKVAASYAPADVLPDLPRDQVPVAANLLLDKEGKIRFYSLLDSRNVDAKLVALTARLEELLVDQSPPVVSISRGWKTAEIISGEAAKVPVTVTVANGYHVQANPASEPFLEPLRLEFEEAEGVRPGKTVYPPGLPHRLDGASNDLMTYEGVRDCRADSGRSDSPARRSEPPRRAALSGLQCANLPCSSLSGGRTPDPRALAAWSTNG